MVSREAVTKNIKKKTTTTLDSRVIIRIDTKTLKNASQVKEMTREEMGRQGFGVSLQRERREMVREAKLPSNSKKFILKSFKIFFY